MVIRLLVALILGGLIGIEREMVGKEVGVRTAMMISAGAAVFSIIGITLPYLVAVNPGNLAEVSDIVARNGGFLSVIANITVGIGFLGAGIIIKTEERVHGLTSAAVVWATAGVGTLAGLGLTKFAVTSAVIIVLSLYLLRRLNVAQRIRDHELSSY